MSTIKLTYFPLAARAFPIRLCLRAAGIAFEDERIPFAALGERRGPTGVSDDIPLGQLPVLSIDGKAYTQSMALARWAAKKAGLYPTDDLKALVVDEVTAAIDEVSKLHRRRSFESSMRMFTCFRFEIFLYYTLTAIA